MRRRTLLGTLASMLAAGCAESSGSSRRAGGGSPLDGNIGIHGDAEAPGQVGIDGNMSVGNGLNTGIEGDDIGIDGNISIGDEEIGITGGVGIGSGGDSVDGTGQTGVEAPPIEEQFAGNEKATSELFDAHERLVAAYDAYRTYAPNTKLLGVNPTIQQFSRRAIRQHITWGRIHARRALRHATDGQKQVVGGLNQAIVFLLGTSYVDETLIDAYKKFETAKEKLYNEADYSGQQYGLTPVLNKMDQLTTQAAEKHQTTTETTDVTAAVPLVPLSPETYQEKLTQLQQILRSFEDVPVGYRKLGEGITTLRRGISSYTSREYSKAISRLSTASFKLNSGADYFQPGAVPQPLKPPFDDRRSMAKTLQTLATQLEESANARQQYELDKYTEKREAAIETLDSRDDIQRIPGLGLIRF